MPPLLGASDLAARRQEIDQSPFPVLWHIVDQEILLGYLRRDTERSIYLFPEDEVTPEEIEGLLASLAERGFYTGTEDCVDWTILTVAWDPR